MTPKDYTRVLIIAGSDSGGCAGIQADLRVLNALKCHGSTAITAITAQNTKGVQQVYPLPAKVIKSQLHAILDDIGVDAIKIGMLFNQEIIEMVASVCRLYPEVPIVLDPVCVASSGDKLLLPMALDTLINELIPLATLITPNMSEAALLMKVGEHVSDFTTILKRLNTQNCLITNGDGKKSQVKDVLYRQSSKEVISFINARLAVSNTHGSGCSLSTAVAAHLAQGFQLVDAITHSISFIRTGLQRGAAFKLGKGAGPLCFW